jgi:hypothetical protein
VIILSLIRKQNIFHAQSTQRILPMALTAALTLLIAAPFAPAQMPLTSMPAAGLIAANTRFDLPDSPGALFSSSSSSSDTNPADLAMADHAADFDGAQVQPTGPRPKAAAHLKMVVNPGEVASPMTVREKVVGGMANSVSLFSAAGWLVSAGWSHMLNNSPNYGTDSAAFGQRLGAAALRGATGGIFSQSLFAPLFHQDPRYYVMGAGHPFLKRAIYAGTRAIITRTDSGRKTPNYSLFAGNAASSALTIEYYPAKNTSFGEVASTFGGSIGGTAVGNVVNEFIVDALIQLHIRKKEQQP